MDHNGKWRNSIVEIDLKVDVVGPGTSGLFQEEDEQNEEHGLDGFPEGPIGKLQVMESGKVRLLIGGGLPLDLEMATKPAFLQVH